MLQGTEVKSMRDGRVNLKDSYARIKDGEIWVYQMHISPYPWAHYDNHAPLQTRKLLLHKREINKLYGKVNEILAEEEEREAAEAVPRHGRPAS